MRRFYLNIFILAVMLGISYAANAQSCQIKGLEDGSSIIVSQNYKNPTRNEVVVNLENDSKSTCANVTVTVSVTYKNSKDDITKTVKCCPGNTTTISFPLDNSNQYQSHEVKISGKKCE